MSDPNLQRIVDYINKNGFYKGNESKQISLKHHTRTYYIQLKQKKVTSFKEYLDKLGWQAAAARPYQTDVIKVLSALDLPTGDTSVPAQGTQSQEFGTPQLKTPTVAIRELAKRVSIAEPEFDRMRNELLRDWRQIIDEEEAEEERDKQLAALSRTSSSSSISLTPEAAASESRSLPLAIQSLIKALESMGVNTSKLSENEFTSSRLEQRYKEELGRRGVSLENAAVMFNVPFHQTKKNVPTSSENAAAIAAALQENEGIWENTEYTYPSSSGGKWEPRPTKRTTRKLRRRLNTW